MPNATPNAPTRDGLALDRPAWMAVGSCAGHPDPDLFDDPPREDEAVDVCRGGCPVRQDCLLYALDRGDRFGVWGGTTPDQRQALARLARTLPDLDPGVT